MTARETLREVRRAERLAARLFELAEVEESQRELDERRTKLVAGLLRDGASWAVIGSALRVDRSTAYRRYSGLVKGKRA